MCLIKWYVIPSFPSPPNDEFWSIVIGDGKCNIQAEVLVLCTSVLAISVSEKDGQADLRHVCLGPRVHVCLHFETNVVFGFVHTSASQCLCEDLCIGVRCEIHRCVWFMVSHNVKMCRHYMGIQALGGLPIHRAQLGWVPFHHTNDASVSSRLKQRWAMWVVLVWQSSP